MSDIVALSASPVTKTQPQIPISQPPISPFQKRIAVRIEQVALAGRQSEVGVLTAFVDEAEQRDELRPGPEPLIHRIGEAAGLFPQPVEQARDGIMIRVNRIARQQAAVFRIQQETPAASAPSAGRNRHGSVPRPARSAADCLFARRRLPESRGSARTGRPAPARRVWVETVFWYLRLFSRMAGSRWRSPSENRRSAPSSICRAANIGRPATCRISATSNVAWPLDSPLGA